MMKKILATEHDVVSVTDEGVRINGTFLPHSMPRKTDGMGRPLPHYRIRNHVLDDTELMLMSESPSMGAISVLSTVRRSGPLYGRFLPGRRIQGV